MWSTATILVILRSVFVAVLVRICIWHYKSSLKRKLPPGPVGLPFLGYLPFLNQKKPHQTLFEIGKKYGPIYSLRFGSELVVMLTDAKVIKECFSKAELMCKPTLPFFEIFPMATPFFEDGRIWQQHRKLFAHTLSGLSLGKYSIQDQISEEIQRLMEVIEHFPGAPFSSREHLKASLSRTISWLIFGKRLTPDEESTLNNAVTQSMLAVEKTAPLLFFPWLKHVPYLLKLITYSTVKVMEKPDAQSRSLFRKEIENRVTSSEEECNSNCYMSTYLREIEACTNKPESTLSEAALLGSSCSLYGAGLLTVLTTIEYSFYVMASQPDVQKKVQDEIDKVVGRERLPTFSDQKSMPYTQSVLMEVQRLYTVLPLTMPRMASTDVKVLGYTIPEGSIVMANFYAAHHDAEYWDNPEEFIPERFIASNANAARNKNLIRFSVGKRVCPGENIAVMETFLYFVCILQNYDLRIPEGDSVDFEGLLYITYQLKPHKLQFVKRSK